MPIEIFSLSSGKSKGDLEHSLNDNIEEKRLRHLFKKATKPMLGIASANEFKAHRSIGYQNSFLPIAIMCVEPTENGSRLNVKLRMQKYTIGFMVLWLSFTFFAIVMFALKAEGLVALAPIGMFCFGYILMQTCFWYEVPKIKSILQGIVQ